MALTVAVRLTTALVTVGEITVGMLVVACIANQGAPEPAYGGTNQGTFAGITGLISDDGAGSSSDCGARSGASLGGGATQGKKRDSEECGEE